MQFITNSIENIHSDRFSKTSKKSYNILDHLWFYSWGGTDIVYHTENAEKGFWAYPKPNYHITD